jgi:hypothetical protein
MYAGQYWLNEALRNASGVLTDDIEQACLVWVDTYCYNQWYVTWRALSLRKRLQRKYKLGSTDVAAALTKAMSHIAASKRFQVCRLCCNLFWLCTCNAGFIRTDCRPPQTALSLRPWCRVAASCCAGQPPAAAPLPRQTLPA